MGERRPLALRHALALGLLHGPSELLPVSSSAHTALVPWLLDWPYGDLDPAMRKSFEVSLHAGTALGLLACPPWRASDDATRGSMGAPTAPPWLVARIAVLAGAIGPPAIAGFVLGDGIERRLGTPGTIAAGLFAGALAMAAAELRSPGSRAGRDAGPRDGLALGAAQALALAPGLSRSGVTTAAARARGFRRADADRLCWQVGLPVIAGAALLKSARQARTGLPASQWRALAVGGGAALLSTRLSARLLTAERRMRLLPATIVYRVALSGLVTARMRWHAAGAPDKST